MAFVKNFDKTMFNMRDQDITRISQRIVSDNIQGLILSFFLKHEEIPLTTMSSFPEFRGKNFGQIMKSAEVLVKRGKLEKTQNLHDGIIYKRGPKFGKTASYNTDTFFIMVGDYGTVRAFSRIFDRININGCTGHSFGVVAKTGYTGNEKPVMKAGFFDGDGAHRVTYIAVGVEGPDLIGDNVFSKVNTQKSKTGSNHGDSILIVKGTESGIEALVNIFDNIQNVAETSNANVKVYTDDNPEIFCGSYSLPYEDDEESEGFGFYFLTQQNFRDPVKFIRDNGYTLDFYRG